MHSIKHEAPLFQRIIRKPLVWFVLILFLFSWPIVQSVTRELPPPLKSFGKFPKFSYTLENNDKVNESIFNGKVTIVNIITDKCKVICPGNVSVLQKIQKRVRGLGQKVAILSYKVADMNIPSSELKEYADKYHANPYVWHFTSGKMINLKQKRNESFFIIDENGFVRGKYVSNKSDINKMMIDIGLLANNSFSTKDKE
ncbi:MAG: hypothetical protein HOJ35_10495 [Bdellovibrionales bacterium]|jgi:protein SCO1|nr:hypothetical protein [Bdellovibrionales bacterium]